MQLFRDQARYIRAQLLIGVAVVAVAVIVGKVVWPGTFPMSINFSLHDPVNDVVTWCTDHLRNIPYVGTKAISDFTKAIELNPIAEAYLDRGAARKDKGDRDGAIADYTKACYERGILRGARGDLDGAIADFTKVIEVNPQHAKAYANRGIIMLLQGHDADAQKEFDTALKIENTLNPDLQSRINQIIRGRKSKP